jgi:DNA-binding LytR/AlgR family response regulator
MSISTFPTGRFDPPFRSWRGAACIVGAWTMLGVLFLVEQQTGGSPGVSGAMVFRRMVGPALGAALTPLGLLLARRFRVEAPRRLLHLSIHALAGVSVTLASFSALYFVHRAAGTLGPQSLPSWLAETLHEGLLYYAVIVLVGHLLQHSPPPRAAAPPAHPAEEDVRPLDHLSLKLRDRTLLLSPEEVAWIEADGHHVRFHLVSGASHTVRDTLRRLEGVLDARRFVRVHRSTLVNVAQVKELRPWFAGDSLLFLKDGTELRMSRRYADRLQGVVRG